MSTQDPNAVLLGAISALLDSHAKASDDKLGALETRLDTKLDALRKEMASNHAVVLERIDMAASTAVELSEASTSRVVERVAEAIRGEIGDMAEDVAIGAKRHEAAEARLAKLEKKRGKP